ncbi:uncharacterized protein CDV56_103055 [Aspergillus thermomutatus]|uniref:Uncharacterized protein n=1 Tax=Aspergillus thermomutatus TaxID=41047 RepID=A0A397GUK0_ASPTH|nr:uncharacterized protein CDV56_103055 [Aspergillus thermomutatus]RHZ53106.1 hypothetical protein CDV56_103055 [Aspergillus thermomutatus]
MPPEAEGSPGPLDSIPLLYSLCQHDLMSGEPPLFCLRSALDAATYSAMANKAKVPTLAIEARRKYGQALIELNMALSSVEDAIRTETLGAIVTLMIFEDIKNERNNLLRTRISGVQRLLKLRGPNQLLDPQTRSQFHFAFTQMIDLDWLMEMFTIPHPLYAMMAGVSKTAGFVSPILSILKWPECGITTVAPRSFRSRIGKLNSLDSSSLRDKTAPTGDFIALQSPEEIIGTWSPSETGIKAIREFALLWPIFNVTQNGFATRKQDRLARNTSDTAYHIFLTWIIQRIPGNDKAQIPIQAYERLPQQPPFPQNQSEGPPGTIPTAVMKDLKKRNKPRLLLGLYARPRHPDSYHYAILITPKIRPRDKLPIPATKYHVKNTLTNTEAGLSQPWRFERSSLKNIHDDPRILVAVVVGKVLSVEMVEEVFWRTPVHQYDDPDRDRASEFDCRTWVRSALERVRGSGGVSGLMKWETLEEQALRYVREKKAEGRWTAGGGIGRGEMRVAMLDLFAKREIYV